MTKDAQLILETQFEDLQTELGIKATLDELDAIFFLKDMAESEGVMPRLDRQICRRIVDTFFSWNGFFHRIIMPNPHSMFESTESGFFNEKDHKQLITAMSSVLAHCSRNNHLGATGNKKAQGPFIDDSLTLWNKLQPLYADITKRVHESWEENAAKPQ